MVPELTRSHGGWNDLWPCPDYFSLLLNPTNLIRKPLGGRYKKARHSHTDTLPISSLPKKRNIFVCVEMKRDSVSCTKPKCFTNTQEISNYKSFIEHLNLYLCTKKYLRALLSFGFQKEILSSVLLLWNGRCVCTRPYLSMHPSLVADKNSPGRQRKKYQNSAASCK